MTSTPLISLVITTFNRSAALLTVLKGLTEQTDKRFEVIVADDGSRPEHVRPIFVSRWSKSLNVVHVWHPDIGFTASRVRNRGVSASVGSYIVFLDGDCVPARDFVAQHRKLAQAGFFVNGSRVLLSDPLSRRVIQGTENLSDENTIFWIKQRLLGRANKWGGLLRLPDWSGRVNQGEDWVGVRSCNLGVWRTDFERVDGFDESFLGWGHEDADFAVRLSHTNIRRKNGFWSTEVFHLWHREAVRDHASLNASTVSQRIHTDITLPTLGYSQQRPNDDAVITRLG